MPDTLEIKSADGASTLEIAEGQAADASGRFLYLDATIIAGGLRVSSRLHNTDYDGDGDVHSLPAFLEEIARDWRGWPSEKRWQSIEGDLKLTCTSATLGNITVVVELRYYGYEPVTWDVRCRFVLESWQLDPLAARAKKVFQI